MLGFGIEAFDKIQQEQTQHLELKVFKGKIPNNISKDLVILERNLDAHQDKLMGVNTKISSRVTNKDIEKTISKDSYYITFIDNEHVIAFLKLDIEKVQTIIDHLFVDSNYRGQGLATKILDVADSIVKKANKHVITIYVLHNNVPAIKLYLKHGFKKFFGGYRVKPMNVNVDLPTRLSLDTLPSLKKDFINVNMLHDVYTKQENINEWNEILKLKPHVLKLSTGHISLFKKMRSDGKVIGTIPHCCIPNEVSILNNKEVITSIATQLDKYKNTQKVNYVSFNILNLDSDVADTLSFLIPDWYGLCKHI